MRSSLLEVTAKEGARRVALRHLDQATDAAARLQDASDAEALHQFRVAVRRLRSGLRAYESLLSEGVGERQRKRLAKLASRTGPGRDADVQLAWVAKLGADAPEAHAPGLRWITERLERQRDEAYADVREELSHRFARLQEKLRARLTKYTQTISVGEPLIEPRFAAFTADVLGAELSAFVDALSAIEDIDDQPAIHHARIVGKRIRYVIEPFRAEVEGARDVLRALKKVQDLLGDLNDLCNLADRTGAAIEEAALARARLLRDAAILGDDPASVQRALSADERTGLLDLLSRVQSERVQRFAILAEEWRGEGAALATLERGVREIAARLQIDPNAQELEIERKYLLRALPPACIGREAVGIDQGYLPGERLIERIRRKRTSKGEIYLRTVKLGEGMVRIEVEEACSAEVFQKLWSLTEGKRVSKRRYAIGEGQLVWEIDEFTDRELWLAEIELPTEDTEVIVPEWLAPYVEREVTNEPEYVNANLAR